MSDPRELARIDFEGSIAGVVDSTIVRLHANREMLLPSFLVVCSEVWHSDGFKVGCRSNYIAVYMQQCNMLG